MKKKKKPSLLLFLGIALLLINGGAAAYWLLSQKKPVLGLPPGANLIPQDASIALSVSTDTNQWQQLRSFGTPQTQAAFAKTLAQLRDRFLTTNGYNYQRDIQPWAGNEVTFAYLPTPPTNPTNSSSALSPSNNNIGQQSVVMILPIEDPLKAKLALEPTNSPLQQGKWVSRTYKGIEIKETKTGDAFNIAATQYSATVLDKRFLVLTTSPKATERIIDTFQNRESLANVSGFKEAWNKIEAERSFARVFINVPVAAAAARNSQPQLSNQEFAKIQQQGVAATMTIKPDGLLFKSISWLQPNSSKKYDTKNEAGTMSSRLPANTFMMMSGGNLQRFWQDYIQDAQSNPLTPFKPEQIRSSIKKFTNLDFEQDLLSWMSGEFSLSLVPFGAINSNPTESQPAANPAPGLVFMVKASDRKTAEKTIQQIDQVMIHQNNFKIEQTTIGNKPVTNWIAPNRELTITQGWLDENIAFLALGEGVTSAIIPQPKTTLVSSDRFRNTVPLELKSNNGHFYLDVERLGVDSTARFLTFLFQLSNDPNTQKTLTNQLLPIRSIGVTAAVRDERSTRLDIFLSLKKAATPKPLPSPTPERFSQPSL